MTRRSPLLSLLVALVVAGCGSPEDADKTGSDTDGGFADRLEAPVVEFVNPEPRTDDDLVARVVEPKYAASAYRFAWTQNGQPRNDLGSIDTIPASSTRRGDVWKVAVVADVGGETSPPGTAQVTVRNTPPTGTLTITPEAPTSADSLVASVVPQDADGDTVETTYRWFLNGVANRTGETVSAASLAAGQTWRVEATLSDGEDETVLQQEVTILNSPPVVTRAWIEPSSPDTSQTLRARVTAADPDGGTGVLSYAWRWFVSGAEVTDAVTDTLGPEHSARGDEVWFEVKVEDADGSSSAWVGSERVVIRNTPPSIGSVTISPTGSATEATVFECQPTGFTDIDGDPEGWLYRWYIGATVIPGATDRTLTGEHFARGDMVSCSARPWDGTDAGPELFSAGVPVVNSLPTVANVRLDKTSPRTTDAVTVEHDPVVDLDGDDAQVRYRWYVGGSLVAGATGKTLSPPLPAGNEVYVEVTPYDAYGDGPTVASNKAFVANSAPVIASLTMSPSPVYSDTTVRVDVAASDADGHALTYTYEWYVGSTKVKTTSQTTATFDTLDGSYFSKNQYITVRVTVQDGFGGQARKDSELVQVVNSLPTISAVSILPASPKVTDTLTCVPQGWYDPDESDVPNYRYRWHVDGELVPVSTNQLAAPYFARGAFVTCTVTPNDGSLQGDGPAVTSADVQIVNAPPSLASATLSSTSPRSGDTLSVVLGAATDPDGDEVQFEYAWYVDDGSTPVATTPTLGGTHLRAGRRIRCKVTPYDLSDRGAAVWTDEAVVANTPPVIGNITLSPAVPRTTDAIVATVTANDADGHLLTRTFTWTINGEPVPDVTGDTLPASYTARGDVIAVTVTVDDGEGGTASRTSGTVKVANTLPTIASVTLDPPVIYETTVVTCVPSGWSDADGDPENYVYEWYVNGARLPGVSDDTLTGTHFSKGQQVRCRARPYDGDPSGPATGRDSATVTVSNSPPVLEWAELDRLDPTELTDLGVLLGAVTDADGDPVTFEYDWQVNGQSTGFTGPVANGAIFDRGDLVRVVVTPRDPQDRGEPVVTSEVEVLNSPPVVVSAVIGPSGASVTDDLVVSVVVVDPDGDDVTLAYDWYVEDVLVTGVDGDTLPAGLTQSGDAVWVEVVADDGFTSSEPFRSGTLVVGNTPPSYASVTLSPEPVTELTVVSCTASGYFDPDGDPEQTPSYRWYVNGVPVLALPTITGVQFKRGDTLQCGMQPYDGSGHGEEVRSQLVIVQNTPPSATSVALTHTSPREQDQVGVVVTGQIDVDGDTITPSYRWFVDDEEVAQTPTLTGTHFDKGQTIHVELILSDGIDETVYVAGPVTAVNTPPTVTTLALSPGEPRVTDDIVATATAFDPDPADTVTLHYIWKVNGTTLDAITGDVLPSGNFVKHQDVEVTVVAHDGTEAGPGRTSAPLRIRNSLPVLEEVVITPEDVDRSISPTCVAIGAWDPDGDSISIDYRWTINGLPSARAPDLPATQFARDQVLQCFATPHDGEAPGNEVASAPVTVLNAPPVVSRVLLSPVEPREKDTIEATVEVYDPDGDLTTWSVSWTVDDVHATTGSRIDGTHFSKGSRVRASATAFDGFATSAVVWSDEVVVRNTPPVASLVRILPLEAIYTDTEVSVQFQGSDDDDDAITWTFDWFVDGQLVLSGPSTVLPGAYFERGNVLTVRATPHDGTDAGPSRTSTARTVENKLPTPPTVAIDPPSAEEKWEDLHCYVVEPGYDADGDPLTYTFTWSSGPYTHTTSGTSTVSTLPKDLSFIQAGQVWVCRARANDGYGDSALSNEPTAHIYRITQTTCAAWMRPGAETGYYYLDPDGHPGPAPGITAWCNMDIAGGGWTRVMRTTGQEHDFGQRTWDIVTSTVPDSLTGAGVFEAFDFITPWTEVLIVQTEGAQAGRYRWYHLVETGLDFTMREALEYCRDQTPQPGVDNAFLAPIRLGHTSNYTGLSQGGDLLVYDGAGNTSPPTYFFLCGVNTSDDNDVAYLSFSNADGLQNDWGDGWRGPAQAGTIWSFANGNYCCSGSGHIGSPSLETLAGWRGASSGPSRVYHEGSYEIYIR